MYLIKLKDDYNKLIESKGFCFATLAFQKIDGCRDIWVSNREAKVIKKHDDHGREFWCKIKKSEKGFQAISLSTSSKESIESIPRLEKNIDDNHIHFIRDDLAFTGEGSIKLSSEKQRQFNLRIANLGNNPTVFDLHNTKVYTDAEYIVELWAKANNLSFLDYNAIDNFAPQDCKINDIDFDVKSVIGIGKRKGIAYSSRGTLDENIIGVHSDTVSLSTDEIIDYEIDGIFSSSMYQDVNLKLRYLKLNSRVINVCYFTPVNEFMLNERTHLIAKLKSLGLTRLDLDYIIYQKHIDYALLLMDEEQRTLYLKSVLTINNFSFINYINELCSSNKLYLLPHFLADFLFCSMVDKVKIDTGNLKEITYQIYNPSTRQKSYIDDVFNGYDAMDKVRCHWHPDETIEKMSVDIYQGFLPTLKACCSLDPRRKTTFFTYSWKTFETIIYDTDKTICTFENCGCLTHQYRDYYLGRLALGKKSCPKNGQQPYDEKKRKYLLDKKT
jgi:hypothetical protein